MEKKQHFKRIDGECLFCGEKDYNLLDAHRIVEGCNGGKYVLNNVVTACATCHRKIHSKRIEIKGKYYSTAGRYVVNYWEDGQEFWR